MRVLKGHSLQDIINKWNKKFVVVVVLLNMMLSCEMNEDISLN